MSEEISQINMQNISPRIFITTKDSQSDLTTNRLRTDLPKWCTKPVLNELLLTNYYHVYPVKNIPMGDITKWRVPWRYQELAIKGSGAFGLIAKAYDLLTRKHVAIKKQSAKRYALAAPFRELNVSCLLDHPNLIKPEYCYPECEQAEGSSITAIYIVMPWFDYSMDKFLEPTSSTSPKAENKMNYDQIKITIYQLLRAVKYLHSMKVLHRDLKPANVLMDADCYLKLIDLGSCRPTERLENNQPVDDIHKTPYITTRPYRAPEMSITDDARIEYTYPADVWALGCILGQLLIGESFFAYSCQSSETQQQRKIARTEHIQRVFELIPMTEGFRLRYQKDIENVSRTHRALNSEEDMTLAEENSLENYVRNNLYVMDSEDVADDENNWRAAFDLLQKMLKLDPKDRISAEQALDHELFEDLDRLVDGIEERVGKDTRPEENVRELISWMNCDIEKENELWSLVRKNQDKFLLEYTQSDNVVKVPAKRRK